MQQQKWVVAGDMLFPEGGYHLRTDGKQALNQYVPQLQGLQNAKVIVYGYTDDKPVGPALQQGGIRNNIDLSSRPADNVVAYLTSQGVNPSIISAKTSATRTRSPRTIRRRAARRTAASRSCSKVPAPKLPYFTHHAAAGAPEPEKR